MVVKLQGKHFLLGLGLIALIIFLNAFRLPIPHFAIGPVITPTPWTQDEGLHLSLAFFDGASFPYTHVERARAAPAAEAESKIVIDTKKRQLTLFLKGETSGTFPVAVGKPSTPTPVGEWKVRRKARHWGGGFGTRWIGLNVPWGIYGIHGTNKPYSIGTAASHGCIRMYNRDVEKIYPHVEAGMPVVIVGPEPDVVFRGHLRNGSSGRDVLLVQKRAREAGLQAGPIDGRFGPQTERAIKDLQLFFGINADGQVGSNVYHLLNIR